jgi:hypothetical protein
VAADQERDAGEVLLEWFEGMRGVELTDAEVEEAARQLCAVGAEALPLLLEQFLDPEEDAALLAVSYVALKAWPEPRPTETLLEMVRHPAVGALSKALIMNILDRYGIEADRPDVLGVAIDLEEFPIQRGPGEEPRILRG